MADIYVSRGTVFFKRDGDADYREIGIVKDANLELSSDNTDVFDKSATTTQLAAKIPIKEGAKFTFETQDASIVNLALFLNCDITEETIASGNALPDGTSATASTVVKTLTPTNAKIVTGALKFVSSNVTSDGHGTLELFKIHVQATGGLAFISDEARSLKFECDVLRDENGKRFTQYFIAKV